MKRTVFLLFAIVLFPVFIFSQVRQDLGLNSSWRGFDDIDNQVNLTGEYTLHLRKFTIGMGLGAECWYVNSSQYSNPGILMKPSFTGKIESWTGFESNLFHSPVFFSAKVGTRFYFLNQLKDSLSLFEKYDDHFAIEIASKRYIENLPNYLNDDTNYPLKAAAYYVTKMPVTFLTRFSLGYAFQRVKVSAYIMPYWVRFYYQNAAYPERTGKTTVFFYDIGLGVNYMLPNKKKETKQ